MWNIKDIDRDNLFNKFIDYIKIIDIADEYFPFTHGTSDIRGKEIKENGILTRNDCRDKSLKQCNIWSEWGKSQDNLTYFGTCMSPTPIEERACREANKKDRTYAERKEIQKKYNIGVSNKDDDWNGYFNEICSFFKIKDPKKYEDKFVLDEDGKGNIDCLKAVYSDTDFTQKGGMGTYHSVPYGCSACLKRLPQKLIDFYDLMFIYGGSELVKKAIDNTPTALFSICEWGTTGVEGSIPPEDIEELSYYEYMDKRDCLKEKRVIRDEHIMLESTHTKEQVEKFKEWIKKNIEKKLDSVGIKNG